MLDPLSALSIASSAAQFIEFGVNLFSYTNEIWNKGSTVDSGYLRKVAIDLELLEDSIHKQLRPPTRQSTLSKEEQALYDLASDCADIARELNVLLEKLIRRSRSGRWQSFRAAVLTIWHKDDVDNLTKRLSMFREQLALRVLVLLNTNQNILGQRLDDLNKDTKEIIEVLSINHNAASTRTENHHRQTGKWHKDSETLAAVRHEEVIAAILTLKDGSKRTLQSTEPSSPFPQSTGPEMETSTTYYRGSRLGPHREANPPGFTVADFSEVPKKVLDCLYFRAIKDRYEVVAEAHQRTFEWLFEDTESSNRPWSNFVQWLAHGHGCYWINGKAGSGKSTLMKFLAAHDKTMSALRSWTSGQELFTASFYFWNAGSTLQKSQAGLLRSLLFQIIEQKQRLIPVLFPGMCRAALAHPHEPLEEPTIAELKKAFTILMRDQIQNAKVCLFIDGIDEYAGDYHEVLDLFKQAVSSDQVKIVLSSRPIPSCVATFWHCPQLRLQDLTYDGIRLYVRDKLYGHELMKRLQEAEGDAAHNLVTSITTKASGVFLWVILVVRSMLDGLENFDRIADLQQRLGDLLPLLGIYINICSMQWAVGTDSRELAFPSWCFEAQMYKSTSRSVSCNSRLPTAMIRVEHFVFQQRPLLPKKNADAARTWKAECVVAVAA